MPSPSLDRYEAASELFRALSSPVRLAIVDLLSVEPRYVHQLVNLTGLTQPTVSQHLRVLRHTRLVRGVRQSREIAYGLRDEHVAHIVRDVLAHSAEQHAPAPDQGPAAVA